MYQHFDQTHIWELSTVIDGRKPDEEPLIQTVNKKKKKKEEEEKNEELKN